MDKEDLILDSLDELNSKLKLTNSLLFLLIVVTASLVLATLVDVQTIFSIWVIVFVIWLVWWAHEPDKAGEEDEPINE